MKHYYIFWIVKDSSTSVGFLKGNCNGCNQIPEEPIKPDYIVAISEKKCVLKLLNKTIRKVFVEIAY